MQKFWFDIEVPKGLFPACLIVGGNHNVGNYTNNFVPGQLVAFCIPLAPLSVKNTYRISGLEIHASRVSYFIKASRKWVLKRAQGLPLYHRCVALLTRNFCASKARRQASVEPTVPEPAKCLKSAPCSSLGQFHNVAMASTTLSCKSTEAG
mmetsp:Transcript_4728/g.10837  ORF Transcript_4728/g.10837 Transcript_4728/m.10837 type:complete len:151 (+) Transcript_4728:1565-2017(+)